MTTLAICASKGGVGKTTLAAGLSVLAGKEGLNVGLIDLDPQRSLARWWELRKRPRNPRLAGDIDTVAEAINVLTENGYDLIIIDTPPALLGPVEPAIEACDLLVIPSRPSPLDVEALDPVVALASKHKRPFVFLLNMVMGSAELTQGARDYLKADGEVLAETIGHHEQYLRAMIDGRTAPEVNRKCYRELAAVWTELKHRLWTGSSKGP